MVTHGHSQTVRDPTLRNNTRLTRPSSPPLVSSLHTLFWRETESVREQATPQVHAIVHPLPYERVAMANGKGIGGRRREPRHTGQARAAMCVRVCATGTTAGIGVLSVVPRTSCTGIPLAYRPQRQAWAVAEEDDQESSANTRTRWRGESKTAGERVGRGH